MKVRVVAYKQKIVIVPSDPEKGVEDGWFPTSQRQGRLGCLLLDTKANLGVSKEAFGWMRRIRRNPEAIGDMSWWAFGEGIYAFSWSGSVHRVIDPATAVYDQTMFVTDALLDQCTVIPNDVPEAAKLVIDTDAEILTRYSAWAEPHEVEP